MSPPWDHRPAESALCDGQAELRPLDGPREFANSISRVRCTVESQVPSKVMTAAGRAHEPFPGVRIERRSEPGSDEAFVGARIGRPRAGPPDCARLPSDPSPLKAFAYAPHHLNYNVIYIL